MSIDTAARPEIWEQFREAVIAVDIAAGIVDPIVDDARLARLAFISLYEKYQSGEWLACWVLRAINDNLFMPGISRHLATAADYVPDSNSMPDHLTWAIFEEWRVSEDQTIPAKEALENVYNLLGRPTRSESELGLREQEEARDHALQLSTI